MFLLNDLKDCYLYNKRIISGIDKSSKNMKKDIAILNTSVNIDETVSLYNNILYKNNFKSLYVPYKFNTIKLRKVVTLNQKDIYEEAKTKMATMNMFKKDIDLYKNLNLIYDLSYETKHIMSELTVKGLKYINFYMNFLESKYLSMNTYNTKIITVPVPKNAKVAGLTINNNENPFNIIYMALYKSLIPEGLKGATFLFHTNEGAFVKFKYTDDTKRTDIIKAFSRITKASSNKEEDIVENEVPEFQVVTSNKVSDELDREDMMDGIKFTYFKKLGVNVNSNVGDLLQSNINDLSELLDDRIGKLEIDLSKLKSEDILKLLMTDKDIIRQSKVVSDIALKGKANEIFIKKLNDKQDEVKFNGKSLPEILTAANNLVIDETIMEAKEIVNEEVKKNRVVDFDNSYYEKQMQKDMVNILTSFNNDSDVKLFVKDIKAENTSDLFTKKMTYTINFLDENRNSHTFKINYPILKDGKFIISGGGRKLILKQLLLLPIVKTKPDTVQITTNYNKLFIYRFGEKLSDGTEFIKKLLYKDLDDSILKGSGFNYRRGNTSSKNKGYDTSLEYGELSKNFSFIENKDLIVTFNQQELLELIGKHGIKSINEDSVFPVALTKKTKSLIYSDITTGEVFIEEDKMLKKINENLTYFIVENLFKPSLTEDKMKEFYAFNPTKTLAYSRARVTGRTIPIIILLSYERGLKDILERYNINYNFVKENRVSKEFGKKRVKFADGYLTYSSLDLKTTLLLDGLTFINTENWSFNQMDTKEPYIEYFSDFHGSRNIGKGLHNMLSLMIDPITKEVLIDLDLPTDIIDLILYGNSLLATSTYKQMNDMSCYRLRGAEQVNALLYKILADSFKTYKDTSNNGNPIKISVDPNILFKMLNEQKTVDEYSILNPSLEIDKGSSVTYKGPSGINLDDAYTTELRAYSSSMYGIVSTPTPDSDKCGAVRQLSYDPKILNIRGMLDMDRSSRNRSTNLYCSSELLNNFTCTHADPPRIGMQSTQQKHTIPVKNQNRPLFGTGVDKTLPFIISDDFVFAAKKPGILESIDSKNEIATVLYDDNTKDIIDLSEIIAKNSNGGFYCSNKKQLMIKEGDRFKVNDVLAKNADYFKGDTAEDIVYSTGKLCKIAVVSMAETFEDSSMISSKMSKDMTSMITMKKDIVLGANSNIDFLINKGDMVKTGDKLVVFDTSFEDSSINFMLGNFTDEIDELTKNEVHSKYTGRIVDVNIYYNHDLEEYTPSMQKILKKYISDNKNKVKKVNDTLGNDSLRLVNLKSIDKIESKKINSKDVDGVLIEIFIEYEDELTVGDKVTYATALKTTICDVFDEDEAPFTEFKPEEELDSVFPSLSIITRQTTDFFFQLYLNKALLGLKDEVSKIWND